MNRKICSSCSIMNWVVKRLQTVWFAVFSNFVIFCSVSETDWRYDRNSVQNFKVIIFYIFGCRCLTAAAVGDSVKVTNCHQRKINQVAWSCWDVVGKMIDAFQGCGWGAWEIEKDPTRRTYWPPAGGAVLQPPPGNPCRAPRPCSSWAPGWLDGWLSAAGSSHWSKPAGGTERRGEKPIGVGEKKKYI